MKLPVANINGVPTVAVNVSAIVGMGGQNRRDDVMLVQGLFNYISNVFSPQTLGLGGTYKVPEITGEMDGETSSAIVQFQIINADKLIGKNGRADSRIHPADYKNRHLRTGWDKRYMAITFLHLKAIDAAYSQGQMTYIQELAKLNPELAGYIDHAIISA